MQKNVLIAGKEVPLGAAVCAGARSCSRNVIVTTHNSGTLIPQPLVQGGAVPAPQPVAGAESLVLEEIFWNRSSAIAARSLILRGERLFGALQEVVLIFDTAVFASLYQDITAAGCSRAIDALISGYLYLTCESLQHFKRNQGGTIVFVHKTDTEQIPNIPVHMAEQAFIGLAEETAKSCRNLPWRSVLVRAETETDEGVGQWLFPYCEAQTKNQCKWVKALSKPGLFGIL